MREKEVALNSKIQELQYKLDEVRKPRKHGVISAYYIILIQQLSML